VLDQVTRSELICGETDSVEVGDCVEITVLEIDGDNVVLRIAGVEESQVVIVGGLAIE
jgi:sRNA-binding carbon storage regulator CsrA